MRITGAVVLLAVGCGGSPFGHDSDTGTELAGAPSSAGSIGAGGAVEPEGGRASSSSAGSSFVGGSEVNGGSSSSSEGGEGGAGDIDVGLVPAPCDRSTWTADAFASWAPEGETPPLMLDGDDATRWASGVPRQAGQWVELKFSKPATLAALTLFSTQADTPRAVALLLDGHAVDVSTTRTGGELALDFEATSASSARIEIAAGDAAAGAQLWWSIQELTGLCE